MRGVLIKLAAVAATLAACVPADAQSETVGYTCSDGVSFRAVFHGNRVVLTTATARYVLRRRGGSLERYGSAKTAFVRDGEDAVLVGAAGGHTRTAVQPGTQHPRLRE